MLLMQWLGTQAGLAASKLKGKSIRTTKKAHRQSRCAELYATCA